MKHLYLDVETTGLYANVCAIHEISVIYEDDLEVIERSWHLRPFNGARVDATALEVCGVTPAQLEQYQDAETVFTEFVAFLTSKIAPFNALDKAFFIGYNVRFDEEFIRAYFKRFSNRHFGNFFWTPSIDVMTLAGWKCRNIRTAMKDFKLKTVVSELDVEVDEGEYHTASYDIAATRALLKALKV